MLDSKYNGYDVHLIESVDELQMIRDLADPKVQVGIDTETTGLNFLKDRVVGVCISVGHGYSRGQYHGFYIPVRHQYYDHNLPVEVVMELTQWLVDNFKTCWFNRNYDFAMLEFDGFNAPFVGMTHDAQIMCHLATSEPFPALKDSVKKYLNFDVLTFESNNAKDHNFATTDPRVSYVYGAQDPLVTVLLARHMWFNFPYIQKIYPVDNKSAEAMRRFSRDAVLPLDFSVLQREYDRVIVELQSVKAQIFALTGYEFSLTSNTDKADALSRFVTLTEKTSNGKFAVSDDVLDRIDHPLARLLQKYAELEKFRGTYLKKMLEFPKEGIRINYSTCSVATGRLSSGAYKGNPYFANFNIQNVPKVEVMRYVHTDPTIGYFINDDSEGAICQMKVKGGLRDAFVCPEGYVWIAADYSAEEMCSCKGTLVETNEGIKKIEDLKPGDLILSPTGYETVELVKETKPKLRCCLELSSGEVYYCSPEQPILVARRKVEWVRFDKLRADDYVVTKQNYGKVSNPTEGNIKSLTIGKVKEKMIDIQVSGSHTFYADGVVAHNCVMADMSGEPNLINPLLQGEDIHNYIAKQMFGFVDKHHRTRVKILNFSVNYGAGAFSIAQKLGISQNEGQELLDTYNRTLGALTRWKEEQKRKARKDGVIFTYFGRPRVMYSFYNSSDHKQHSFGDRTAVNSPVQGFGGDLIRIDHVKLMNKFLTDPEFADNVKYCLTVHDEIDLFVKPAYLYKCFKTLTGIMDFRPSNLKVPIVSSPSIGLHWGVQVEADDVTPNNHIKINLEKCEPLDGQTQEEMEQAIKEWESQENY